MDVILECSNSFIKSLRANQIYGYTCLLLHCKLYGTYAGKYMPCNLHFTKTYDTWSSLCSKRTSTSSLFEDCTLITEEGWSFWSLDQRGTIFHKFNLFSPTWMFPSNSQRPQNCPVELSSSMLKRGALVYLGEASCNASWLKSHFQIQVYNSLERSTCSWRRYWLWKSSHFLCRACTEVQKDSFVRLYPSWTTCNAFSVECKDGRIYYQSGSVYRIFEAFEKEHRPFSAENAMYRICSLGNNNFEYAMKGNESYCG